MPPDPPRASALWASLLPLRGKAFSHSTPTKKLGIYVARHGIPDQVVSDNGQPFASDSFHEFASTYGFEHVTSSPMYAQSMEKRRMPSRQPNHS